MISTFVSYKTSQWKYFHLFLGSIIPQNFIVRELSTVLHYITLVVTLHLVIVRYGPHIASSQLWNQCTWPQRTTLPTIMTSRPLQKLASRYMRGNCKSVMKEKKGAAIALTQRQVKEQAVTLVRTCSSWCLVWIEGNQVYSKPIHFCNRTHRMKSSTQYHSCHVSACSTNSSPESIFMITIHVIACSNGTTWQNWSQYCKSMFRCTFL